ncbi:MAG: hypothetical protein IPN68_18310 [Bacteroidetes bacterium]|nr:hypothetical protein [Bacteroidota bacterium]
MAYGKVPGEAFLERYYALRRAWFKSQRHREKSEYEENEVVPPYTRDQLVRQFANMGVEIPMSPEQEPVLLGGHEE